MYILEETIMMKTMRLTFFPLITVQTALESEGMPLTSDARIKPKIMKILTTSMTSVSYHALATIKADLVYM